MKDQVIEEIKRLCGKVEWMPGLGYYFMINDTLCLYMYCRGNGSLRFAIPYLATTTAENKEKMMTLINQANREVKYIKVTLLDNGSLTLTYDHKMVSGEKPAYSGDTRSPIPVISVHIVSNLQYRRQS